MDIELQSLEKERSNGDGAAMSASEQLNVPIPNGVTHAERNPLLHQQMTVEGSLERLSCSSQWPRQHHKVLATLYSLEERSEHPESNGDSVVPGTQDVSTERRKKKVVCEVERLTTALNANVFWKCKVWMTILFILLFIAAVIFTSIVLCSVFRKDLDDTFDSSSYEVPRNFNGTFRLTSQMSAEELLTSSNQSQALASQLQKKLHGLYSDSPALGRYFSNAEIDGFRNGSTEAVFSLSFLLPREDHQQPLSHQLVYKVLHQFLYDQDTNPPGPLYIEPASLQLN